ncbi:MAG: response regulator [Acetivibrionales bacterium]
MYRLMIADDEYLSRFVFKSLIAKTFKNIEIAGEAENGRQAVEINRKLRPDIIIMDIKMPGINGIDASRQILNEFPEVSVLILTAYDNFDYVKSALEIGVKGYILKPVKEEEAVEKINKVINDMEERKDKYNTREQVEKKVQVVRPFIENELISAFMAGNFDVEKVQNYISFLQEEIRAGYFMLISPEKDFSKSINDAVRNKLIRNRIYSVACNHLPMMRKCFFGNCLGNTIVAFFPVDENLEPDDLRKEAVIVGREIKNRIKVITGFDTVIGIGNVKKGIWNLNKSYNEAHYALRRALKEAKVVHYASIDIIDFSEIKYTYPLELENQFIENIKLSNIDKAKELAGNIMAYIFDNQNNIEAVKECISEFIVVLKRTAVKLGANLNLFSITEVLAELGDMDKLEEIELWCKIYIYNMIEQIEKSCSTNTQVINMVIEYIDKHFHRDITLKQVAEEVGLSPQYLSRMFKEKYGSNFIDYVTKKRVKYAEEFLCNCNKSIKEISRMAGYEDSNYFCRIFKRDTGMTPTQYRSKNISGGNG